MNKHHPERANLLYLTKSGIPNQRRPAGPITQSDYAAVYTPPTNNPIPFYGPCLIWRHRLDADGYGTLRLDGRILKARRNATAAALAHRIPVLHAAPGGKTAALCQQALAAAKPVYTLPSPHNAHLIALGAQPISPPDPVALLAACIEPRV